MVDIQRDRVVEVPNSLVGLLDEYLDVMPIDLSNGLPPRRYLEHHIELLPGAKIVAKAPYRMSFKELT